MALVKTMVRLGVIGTAVGAATVVVAGPDRVMALIHQAQSHVNQVIDANIDDPIALRNQLRNLEREYPARISEVTGELSAVDQEMAQLQRDLDVAQVKVQLTAADLGGLEGLIDKAEQARIENASYGAIVRISHGGRTLGMDDAYAKANRIKELNTAFSTQASDLERNLDYLGQQRERLADLLDQLTSEQAEFQTKILQLDQEIDAIARNDRLLEMLESRQRRLDNLSSRYSAPDLGALTANLQETRAEQEARFEMLARGGDRDDYDERAKYLLDRGLGSADEGTETIEISPSVIQIGPDHDDHEDGGRVASRD